MGIWDGISSSVDECAIKPTKTAFSYSRAAVTETDKAVRNMIHRLHLHEPEVAGSIAANCAMNTALYAIREGVRTFPGGGPVYDIISRSLRDGIGNKKKKCNDDKQEYRRMIEALNTQVNDYKERTQQLQSEMEDYKEKTIQLQDAVSRLMEGKQLGSEKKHLTSDLHNQAKLVEPKLEYQMQEDVIRCFVDSQRGFLMNRQPEDAIRGFMMKGFLGAQVLDSLKSNEKCELK